MTDNLKKKSQQHQHQQQEYNLNKFDYNLPRPPVPGEENIQFTSDWSENKSSDVEFERKDPPQLPPKPQVNTYKIKEENEPSTSKEKEISPLIPPCIRWAKSLLNLLNDSDGVAQFMDYLEGEGPHHAAALKFWLACEGVRKQDQQDKAQQYSQAIFSIFVQSPFLPIKENLRKQIAEILNSDDPLDIPVTIFDEAQLQVENEINATTYPNFLQSDIYLQCLQAVQSSPTTPDSYHEQQTTNNSDKELENIKNLTGGGAIGSLPTLYEDLEFISKPFLQTSGCHTPNQPFKLTKDLLLLSQQHRATDFLPQSEAFAGFLYRNTGGAHAAYNSYNPVSRQDSEMQSLSSRSDVRTESDNMSLTDSSIDGRQIKKRKAQLDAKFVKASAAINRETNMNEHIVPRTLRPDATRDEPPRDPKVFADILIKKLETINEKTIELEFERRMKETEPITPYEDRTRDDRHRSEPQSRELANVLKAKLSLIQTEDDNVQDILDQHVSRVFSDLTPSRSPGLVSPRPHSPHRNRYQIPPPRPKRRDKDGYSTFSADSGNVHDFQDGSEHRLSMVKSKSMPDYGNDRFVRGSTTRRSVSKKTLTDLTDSGVSVVSDTLPTVPILPSSSKENRVRQWLLEADRTTKSQSGPHSEISSKHKSHRTSPISNRYRNKTYGGSRSNSLERNNETLGPAQPFVADPNMPPPSLPNTGTLIEEARRRLDDELKIRSRIKSSKYPDTQSGQSTLRKSTRNIRQGEEFTTFILSFADEKVPYLFKIPGYQITFKQFKEYSPKKGNYRYFFKTVCKELDNQMIQEEINRDNDILPLCDGKVMALAKPID